MILSSADIPLSVGPVNLNWAPIMKTINESPYEFFQQGGWSFLGGPTGANDVSKSHSSGEASL
jgi:nucleosome binding factor SPN SPT16 subunit